jgi:hypothetical protein
MFDKFTLQTWFLITADFYLGYTRSSRRLRNLPEKVPTLQVSTLPTTNSVQILHYTLPYIESANFPSDNCKHQPYLHRYQD